MDLRATQVNLTGLLEVLGRNLYSTPNVVLRELVQNAHDSCTRRRLENATPFSPTITVTTNETERTLTIADNGAGLTKEEIGDYLATIGTGYTGKLRREEASEALIGEFGLGFLSAYVVADRIEFWTTSVHTQNKSNRFSSNGGERYSVVEAPARSPGSSVTLHLKAEFSELSNAERVYSELDRYCPLLDVPIVLNGNDSPVNDLERPWVRNPRDEQEEPPGTAAYRRLAAAITARFEPNFGAICTLPIEPAPDCACAGMLWIHDRTSYATSDNRNLSIFVRGMLVSDDVRNLLPSWAGFIGGVIEADHLIPTASRESLKEDAAFEIAKRHISDALISGLASLPTADRDRWFLVSKRHNEALLGAALSDDRLFSALSAELRVPTTEGELTIDSIIRHRRHLSTPTLKTEHVIQPTATSIHITSGAERGPEELVFRALRLPIVLGERFGALAFSQRYAESLGLDVFILGTNEGNREVFEKSLLSAEDDKRLKVLFRGDYSVKPVSFAPAYIPLLVLIDQQAVVKARLEAESATARIGPAALQLARLHTKKQADRPPRELFLNSSSPLIHRLLQLDEHKASQFSSLLLAFANCTTASEQQDDEFRLDHNLQAFSSSILSLLDQ